MFKTKNTEIILFTAGAVFIQLTVCLSGSSFYLTQLTMSAYYTVVAVSLTLFMGFSGQISLCQGAFFAVGGYTAALLFKYNYNITAGLPLVMLVILVLAVMLGKSVLKLKGHYLALATLAAGIIIYKFLLSSPLMGQADGISGTGPLTILPGITVSSSLNERIFNYYFATGFMLTVYFFLKTLVQSPAGLLLKAVHADENAAEALGIDTARIKLKGFIIAAVCAGLAGFFAAHYNGGISPSQAHYTSSIKYVAIVALSGFSNLRRTLLLGMLLYFISLRGYFGVFDEAVFAVILIISMLLNYNIFSALRAAFGRTGKA
ncbi:MAG TPA: branched-chain amino acid ABC transporter permease [Spirochaetota bacterium]|nr:branched-chain amino acid ABC transporter permease [Spirochaetota bacterium]